MKKVRMKKIYDFLFANSFVFYRRYGFFLYQELRKEYLTFEFENFHPLIGRVRRQGEQHVFDFRI